MPPLAVLVAAWLADAALLWVLVFRRRGGEASRPLGTGGLLRAALLAGLFAFAQSVLLVVGVWRPFLAIAALDAFLFLVLPPAGLLVALGVPRRATPAARWTAGLGAALIAGVGVWGHYVEPDMVVLERAHVPLAPARAGEVPLVVGVLADIQCEDVTARERDAVAQVMAARPDLILIPGDLIQPPGRKIPQVLPRIRALLASLHAPMGVYLVVGNTDLGPAGARALTAGTGVRVLVDELVELRHGDRRVTLAGMTLNRGDPASDRVLWRLAAPGDDDVRLLLAHRPDWVLDLPPGGRVDLVVAGHTHGGQVHVPFLGPPITLSAVPREAAGGGLHVVNGTRLYVSRGLGTEHGDAPRVRFLCPPEVTLLTLATDDGEPADHLLRR